MDTLSRVLEVVRLTGGVFSRARLTAPWAISSHALPDALFHVVVRGAGRIEGVGAEPVAWRAGDLVLLPGGAAHVMAAGAPTRARNIAMLPGEPGSDGIPCVHAGGGGEETLLLCGTLQVHPAARAFVMGVLPPLVHVRPTLDRTAEWLDTSLRLLTAEQLAGAPGSVALSRRLAEMLFVQILRAHASQPGLAPCWLRGLGDDKIGEALTVIHTDLTADLSVATLARRVGMSRSVFFERFRSVVGEAPRAYLRRWRMVVARMALSEGGTLSEAAHVAGYGSEASFARAFKRAMGMAPGVWRTQEQGAVPGPLRP